MERFFRSLKNEWVPATGYVSFSDAAHAITDYIVGYYSALRPHEYNGGLPPNESENRYWKNSNSVASFVDHFTYTRQGYAIEAITATIDWIKENGFSLIKAGVNPENTLSKITYQDWLQFFEHRRWVSIFMFWIKQRRIISRREKPMRPFQAYFNMHSSVSSAFSSKWVGIQFPKYITLFLLKHIPPITTC